MAAQGSAIARNFGVGPVDGAVMKPRTLLFAARLFLLAAGCSSSSPPAGSASLDSPPAGCSRTLCDAESDVCQAPSTPDYCSECFQQCEQEVASAPGYVPDCADACNSVCQEQGTAAPSDPCADALTACRRTSDNTICVDDGSAGGISIQGSVQGTPMPATDLAGIVGTAVQDGNTVAYAGVVVVSVAGACSGVLQPDVVQPNMQMLSLTVAQYGTVLTPGSYGVGDGGGGAAQFTTGDAQCNEVIAETASAGTITVDVADGSIVAGTFDVTFPGGDEVAGSFAAPVCPVDLAAGADGGAEADAGTTCGS